MQRNRETTEWERLDFKKIRDTKGTFHAKMGSIKDRNGMDLTDQKILREVASIHRTVQKRSSRPR